MSTAATRRPAGGYGAAMCTDMRELWTSPAWRHEVESWLYDVLSSEGIEVVGVIEQPRVRLWSTQLVVPTSAGQMWFKENHPGQRAEAAVVDKLAKLMPEHVVVPVAVERRRGWLLTPDHGPTLATLERTDETLWIRVVAEYADMQRRLRDHRADLVDAGLAPLLPLDVADHVEKQVVRMRRLPVGDALHIDAELADRVLRSLPALRATAERLDDVAPLASLEHNDLHQNNVFIPHADEVALRFFDFADAVWAHPFTSLAVPVGVLCRDWEVEPSDARVRRVVDAYVEPWSDVASLPDLREAAALALVFGPVHRFESWRRLLDGSAAISCPDEAEAVRHWLGRVAQTPARTR